MGWGGFLGVEYGIVQAPLGPDISGPPLVAAVANAGGLGLLRAPDEDRPELVKEMISRTRELTDKPFGIGVILEFPHRENVKAILEDKVPVMHVSWGDFPKELVDEAHAASVKVIHQVGSVEAAEKAAAAGVDGVVVQGVEAGGHVIGQLGIIALLPRVAEVLQGTKISIIAAGGIVDACGYVSALALGAHGICLGTRFVATHESHAHSVYKQKIVQASENDTEYTNLFGRARWPGAAHRVLKSSFYEKWKHVLRYDENELNQPVIGQTMIYGQILDVLRFSGTVPNETTTGDLESMVMYAGEGVGRINEVLHAAEVVRGLVEGAQHIIEQRLTGIIHAPTTKFSCVTMV